MALLLGCAPPEPHNAAEARAYHLGRFGLKEMPRAPAGGDSLLLWLTMDQAFDSTAVLVVERAAGRWRATAMLQTTLTGPATRRRLQEPEAGAIGLAPLNALASLPVRPSGCDSILVFDGCSITAELRDSTGYKEWYYNNPWSYRTAADLEMINVVEQALGAARILIRCGSY